MDEEITSGQLAENMLSSGLPGETPQKWEETPPARRGDKYALVAALRQCAIIIICACDDYLGRDRTIRTKRRRD